MLKVKRLPYKLSAEVVHTAVYILNRSPTKAIVNNTPFEAWHRRKPEVGSFRVFGCIAYTDAPSQQRESLMRKRKNICSLATVMNPKDTGC